VTNTAKMIGLNGGGDMRLVRYTAYFTLVMYVVMAVLHYKSVALMFLLTSATLAGVMISHDLKRKDKK
jgi:hypothetical protein